MGKKYREDRREFLRSLGRGALLGGLILGAGALVRREAQPTETCTNTGICPNCPDLKACGLPQALSYKQSKTN